EDFADEAEPLGAADGRFGELDGDAPLEPLHLLGLDDDLPASRTAGGRHRRREAMAADLGGVVDDDVADGVSSSALACLLHDRTSTADLRLPGSSASHTPPLSSRAAPAETHTDGPPRAPLTDFLTGFVSDRTDPGGTGSSSPAPPEHQARGRVPSGPRGGTDAHPAGAPGGRSPSTRTATAEPPDAPARGRRAGASPASA